MAGREIKRRVRACPLDVLGGQALPEGESYRTSSLIDFSCLVTARKCVPLVRDPMSSQSTGGQGYPASFGVRLQVAVAGATHPWGGTDSQLSSRPGRLLRDSTCCVRRPEDGAPCPPDSGRGFGLAAPVGGAIGFIRRWRYNSEAAN